MKQRGAGNKRREAGATRGGRAAVPGSKRNERESAHGVERRSGRGVEQRSERGSVAPPQTAAAVVAPALPGGVRLYGVAPVLEALRAGQRPLEQITIADGAHHFRLRELLELAHRSNVPVRRAPRAELERMTGAGVNHQGVVAGIAAARYSDPDEFLESLAARIGTDEPPLAVVLDGVEDPRNLGAIIRTIECAGAHGVLIPERRAVGLTEIVAKTAAGALEHVPVARAANLTRLIEQLKERNIWTIGTSADAGVEYTDWDFTQATALVLGGEGAGLHRLVREHCDVLVRIPVRGRIESLNVSVAAGILLYEALRQRTVKRSQT
jgi:23S rRNA (guanosine2251-2'-O)-methyltransferase